MPTPDSRPFAAGTAQNGSHGNMSIEICQFCSLDDAVPSIEPRLADGRRFHSVLGTPPSPGTSISLWVPAGRTFWVEDCVASGSLTPGAAQLLSRMIEAKLAFLISGGTGPGNPANREYTH